MSVKIQENTENKQKKPYVIAIDGEAATGKSSCGKKLAAFLDFAFIDTGFYYRYLTWLALKVDFKMQFATAATAEKLIKLAEKNAYYDFTNQTFFHNQTAITKALFSDQITDFVTNVSTNPILRNYVTKIVRSESRYQNTVMVGRDTGSNIAQDAEAKFFLTVNQQEQVRRRMKQTATKNASLLAKTLQARDESDKTRQFNPLKPVADSIILDTSGLTVDNVVTFMLNYLEIFLRTKLPQIILLGPTNVGKSTLFNQLINEQISLVSPTTFTTRDLVKKRIVIGKSNALLIDSGGFEPKNNHPLHELIFNRNLEIVKGGAIFLLVFDLNELATEKFKWYFNMIKRLEKPTILVLNKLDRCKNSSENWASYQKLGIKEQIMVSAKKRTNLLTLKKMIEKHLLTSQKAWEAKLLTVRLGPIIGIFGQTNVGKSSLFNALVEKKVALTAPFEHTTTNLVQYTIMHQGHHFNFIDTAGQRKKRRKMSLIELAAQKQGEKIFKILDLTILVLDASKEISAQDRKLARILFTNQLPILLIVNKSDLLKRWSQKITVLRTFPKISEKNLLFTNSLNLKNRRQLLNTLLAIFMEKKRQYTEKQLQKCQKNWNNWMQNQTWTGKIKILNYTDGKWILNVNSALLNRKIWQKTLEKEIIKTEKFRHLKPFFVYKSEKIL